MLEENICKTEATAKKAFPHEQWENATSLVFNYKGRDFDLPDGIENIKVARSRLTGLKDDERTLAKEIRQGKILSDKGDSIYLIPKIKGPDGKNLPGPDAFVNGVLFEFKTITGGLDRVEIRFRQSRGQCINVFLKIDNPGISKGLVITKIKTVLKDKKYTGGTKGNLILYLSQTGKTYFMRIKELK